MTPIIPYADPLPLPGPVWLLWFLLVLTFTLHVVAMNLLLGGAVVGAVSRWRSRSGDGHETELARVIGKGLPVLTAATVTLGVAALLFLQVLFGRLFFPSAVLIAWYWLAVVPILIVAYYSAYAVAFRGRAPALGLAATSAVLLLAIAFIYTNNMALMARPDLFAGIHARGGTGFDLPPFDRLLALRFFHMVTGAIAVAGAGVCALGFVRLRREAAAGQAGPTGAAGAGAGFGRWAIARGSAWFAGATILNMAWGVWYLGSLPTPTTTALIGGSPPHAAVLGLGIVSGLAALGAIFAASKAEHPGRLLGAGLGALVLTLVLMILTRDFVRGMALGVARFNPQTWVQPQWGPIAIFAALLVAAIATVWWMVVQLLRRAAPAAHDGGRAV